MINSFPSKLDLDTKPVQRRKYLGSEIFSGSL